jgi:hypothetical protein
MLSLANYPYSRQEIIDALHGKYGQRHFKFRYDLLDMNDNKIGELDSVVDGEVSMASLSSIKRTARFKIKDKGDINWLTDRIQPFVELKMPEKAGDASVSPTFSRSSVAYKKDGTQVASGQPRFEAGKFGRGIMIEEGTTNLVPNPLATNDLTAIKLGAFGGSAGTIERVTTTPISCPFTTAVKANITTGGDFNVIFQATDGVESTSGINVNANTTYTISVWVFIPTNSNISFVANRPIEWTSGGGVARDNGTSINTSTKGQWVRFSRTITTTSTTAKMTLRFYGSGTGEFYVTGVQLEQKAYATSFINGTRAAETLTIPTKDVVQEGKPFTMECWGICDQNISPSWRMPFTSWQKFYVGIVPNSQKVRISWIDSAGAQKYVDSATLSVDFSQWHYWAFVYDGQQCRLFINGVLAVTANTNLPKPFAANIDLGRLNSNNYFWDGIIDDFRISSRARTDEEILAAYQSNSPLPVDKYTTYKLNFDGNLTAKTFLPSQWIEFPLGIFLLSSPTRKDSNNNIYREVEAYDGLLILRDDKFDSRYTVPAGTNYRQAVIDILASAGITKHNIEQTDKVLPVDMEFAPGTEKLEAINALLQAINYTPLYVDVYGYFTSMTYRSPSIRAAEYTYKDDELSIVYPGMEERLDLFNVPNKWVVVCSNAEQSLMSSYTNSNPNSPTSTVNRGRTIVDYREVTDIADQQSLDAYVQRIAFEASQVYGKLTFETALNPLHDYMDVLEIDYSPLGIKGKYVETGWTMPLKAGARMKHEVRKVVSI